MFQSHGATTEPTTLIPMEYDSLKFFPYKGVFTAVYNNGKVGFYLSQWVFSEYAKQSVPCEYDAYRRKTIEVFEYLAVSKKGKWAWIDWMNGEEKTAFKYKSFSELPAPSGWKSVYYEDEW